MRPIDIYVFVLVYFAGFLSGWVVRKYGKNGHE
jgi:hypothetical protein